ncbi:hypothetical protein K469DRAFT_581164 [Zopfia rhizophila CBS 207.26]|uniref:Rhodopsin domain-containing protein n=1 Tax=Zopfia rhizophila CBS 207.26 TaxID=1314779 RepID=A0A6A6DYL3_9PEZI|nr:hypothetical protein K469DRAFT_581164 [Zopfia rhizophila CBS 207.26]
MDQLSPAQLAALKKEDKGPTTIAICVAFTIFSFICVSLRVFTRIKYVRDIGLEDYFIALSMLFSIAMAVCQILQVHWGNGTHVMFLSLPQAIYILKYLYFSILCYCMSLALTKISILLQYRRIFSVKEMRLPIYIVMGICVAYGIVTVVTGIFACIPVDAFWDVRKKPTARCVDEHALWYANGGMTIGTDMLVAALPIKAIWDLQMPRKQKIALLVILTLGWFVCIVSMLRLNALAVLARHMEDTTWYGAETAYWSSIEVNLAIVCASTPALKPLIVRIIPRFAARTYASKPSASKGTKESHSRKSFIELKEQRSSRTISEDLEMGDTDYSVTALSELDSTDPGQYIRVTKEVEQHFEELVGRSSEHGSQKILCRSSPSLLGR